MLLIINPGENIMEDKKSYLQKMADQLKEWDREINDLKARVSKARAESKTELLNQIDELHKKQENAHGKLKQLQDAGDDAWDEMKTGLERSWTEFKSAFSNASSKFKQGQVDHKDI
jgi:recombinational DNA repair ATPase RecF